MPYDEIKTRTIRENQALISPYAACSWATAPEQFNIGINKGVLASFLETKGIPNPPSSLPQDQEKKSNFKWLWISVNSRKNDISWKSMAHFKDHSCPPTSKVVSIFQEY